MADILGEILRRKAKAKSETAFNAALVDITEPAGGQTGPFPPGAGPRARLTPAQADAARALFQASPAIGGQILSQMLSQRATAMQNTEARQLQWVNADLAREQFDLRSDEFQQQLKEFDVATDPVQQRALRQAQDIGAVFIPDPLQGGRLRRTPTPGTTDWFAITDAAAASKDAAQVYNEYMVSVAQFGMVEDLSSVQGAAQDSLRTQLVFAIKSAEKAGALDQGLIDITGRLTGEAMDVKNYWFGADAASLARIAATGEMFQDSLDRSAEATRLITGWNPQLRGEFNFTRQRTDDLRGALIPSVIKQIQGQGGMVPTPAQQMPAGNMAERAQQRVARGAEITRELGGVIGGELGTIISGLLGFAAGRVGR